MSRQVALWVCLHCFWFLHRAESNSFVEPPGVVRDDVTGSAALEWTLESEPGRDDAVGFTFTGADVFRYEPYTGIILLMVVDGPDGNPSFVNASYDPRLSIYNTSTRGVGFRLAGLSPKDAGTYTCTYESLSPAITKDAVLFVYDVPGKPSVNEPSNELIEGNTNVSLECKASSTSLPMIHRTAMLYTWSRNGVNIDRTAPPARHAVLGDRGETLAISPVHHTDTTYTCTASENGTNLSSQAEVTLDVKPPSLFGGSSIVIVASAAAGGVLLLIIIIVVAVCCARRRRKKKESASVEDLVPYGSTTANDTLGFANGAVAADQGTTLYAEVGKEHNRVGKPATKQDVESPPPVIYAQVNKTKKGKKDKTEKEAETNGGPEPVLYAQVDKNRPRKGKGKATGNGQKEDELTVAVPSHYDDVEGASAPHNDHVTSVAGDPYTDIASAGHGYSNNEQGQGQPLRPPKKIKGFTYSELTFARDTEAQPEVIHTKEPPTQYSEVDFSRTAPPSN